MIHSLKNKILNLKYRQKLLLTYFIISIIPLTVLGNFCYKQVRTLLLEQETTSMQTALDTAVRSMDHQISLYNDLSDSLTTNKDIIETASKTYQSLYEQHEQFVYTLDPILQNAKSQHDEIRRITLYTSNKILPYGDRILPADVLLKEPWFDTIQIKATPIWKIDSEGNVYSIRRIPTPYVKYIRNYSENYLYLAIDYKEFFQSLKNISTNYHLTITNEVGIIYDYHSESLNHYHSDDWIHITAKIPSCNWTISLKKPAQIISQNANQVIWTVLLIIGICLIILIILSGVFSYAIVARIRQLRDNMMQVEQGDLTVTVVPHSQDEIGDLIRSFQHMISHIQKLIKEVYESRLIQKEAELKALQSQINPHFLYNCLSLINSKAIINHQPEISKMALHLSTFYRTTLNKGKNTIPVSDELKNIKSYLEIQLLMHNNSFDVEYRIDSNVYEYTMINLLLQPLVENAILHGIDCNKGVHGKILIQVWSENKRLLFRITDNGVGIPANLLPNLLQKDSCGYGLKNVHERIQLYYGKDYGLTIQSTPGLGTCVSFCIPAIN